MSLIMRIRIVLKLSQSAVTLPEVEIQGNVPHVAYDNKVVSVKDFEINEKGIYLLAQRRRNNALLHLNFACDTLTELKISPDYYNIFKDVYGEMHIVSEKDVWQVGHKTYKDKFFDMELMYHSSLNEFLTVFQNIACATDSLLIGGQYFFFDQAIYYYYFNIGGNQQLTIVSIRRDATTFSSPSNTGGAFLLKAAICFSSLLTTRFSLTTTKFIFSLLMKIRRLFSIT